MGIKKVLLTSLAGAGLMYFFDPNMGRRRRSLLQDKLTKLSNTMSDRAETVTQITTDNVRGAAAEIEQQFRSDDVSDETLVARVRSEMGRYVSHPGAIEVSANAGVVTLSGNILSQQVQPFVAKVKTMPGVQRVENNLQMHEDAGNIPDLQGGKTRPEML